MRKALLRLIMLFAPFMLSACGEGWVAQKTSTYFPYGNQRTAGTGVVYVRAKMMPEKELQLAPETEAAEEVMPPPEEEVKPVLDAEDIFEDAQTKGAAPAKRTQPEESMDYDGGEGTMKDDHTSVPTENQDKHASLTPEPSSSDEMTAEQYISQAPKQIDVPEVRIIEAQPAAGVEEGEIIEAYASEYDMHGDVAETIETYENKIEQPAKEIVSPKKDIIEVDSVVRVKSVGQLNLSEIYQDPFAQ